jgi:hypothetical protein
MNSTHRQSTPSIKWRIALVALVTLIMSAFPAQYTAAQEATAEVTAQVTDATATTPAEVTATEQASPAATEAPPASPEASPVVATAAPEATVEATAETTVEAIAEVTTEATTEAIAEVTAEATAEATDSLAAPEIIALTSFADAFDVAWTGEGWSVVGWSLATDANGNAYLTTTLPNATATINNFSQADIQVTARLQIAEDNTAEILVRAGAENYRVMISAQGLSRLYRGQTLLDAAAIPEPATEPVQEVVEVEAPAEVAEEAEATAEVVAEAEATAETTEATVEAPQPPTLLPELPWYSVTIIAANGTIGVQVDGVAQIAYTDENPLGAGSVTFSSGGTNTGAVALDDVAVTVVDPATVIIPVPAKDITTAVESVPSTAGKVDERLTKLIAVGDNAEALTAALAELQIVLDDLGRIQVVVWKETGTDLSAAVATAGGEVKSTNENSDLVLVPLSGILTLASDPLVQGIELPVRAVSTGPIGTGSSLFDPMNSFDAIGAEDWHQANVKGTGVKVAVIDVGFGGIAVTADTACVGSFTTRLDPLAPGLQNPSSSHGVNMIEVICDIAPSSQVFMYPADSYAGLYYAVQLARTQGMNVIVIAIDLGVAASFGDGQGNGDSTDPYTAIAAAKAAGIPVIASAGNNGFRNVDIIRTVAFNYTGSGASFNIAVPNGGYVNMSHSATSWLSTANRPTVSVAGYGSNSLVGDVGHQYGPVTCGSPTQDTDGDSINDSCVIGVTVSGAANVVIQVQVLSATSQGRISSNPAGILTTFGTLARPADSPNVITTGSVCAKWDENYSADFTFTSRGPIYGQGGGNRGTAPAAPPTVKTRAITKPDIVSFANVGTSLAPAGGDCFTGFGGSSSASAHVAGMVALLKSNTTNASMNNAFNGVSSSNVDAILDYLQARTVDKPLGHETGLHPDGFDMTYGAGLSTLGSPYYNLAHTVNYTVAPNNIPIGACSQFIYVGKANPGATTMDGTQANPYLHLSLAIQQITANNTCIIAMPGEYVETLYIEALAADTGVARTGRKIFSYDFVHGGDQPDSIYWVNTQYYDKIVDTGAGMVGDVHGAAQIFMNAGTNGMQITGFVFVGTKTFDTGGNVINEPQAVILLNTQGAVISESNFGKILYNTGTQVVTYEGWKNTSGIPIQILGYTGSPTGSDGSRIEENVFEGIVAKGNEVAAAIYIKDSGTNASPVSIRRNRFIDGKATKSPATQNDWGALIYAETSNVGKGSTDIVNNEFIQNSGETLIHLATANQTQTNNQRVMGNIFLANTIVTEDGGASNTGSLVNVWYGRNLYFINNTVVNNVVQNLSSQYGAMIQRGDPIESNGFIGNIIDPVHQRMSIFNNVIYNNTFPAGLMGDSFTFDEGGFAYECKDVNTGTVNEGFKHNWVYGNIVAIAPGQEGTSWCAPALPIDNNDNIYSSGPRANMFPGALANPATAFIGYALNTDADPLNDLNANRDPEYYAPRVTSESPLAYSYLVDTGSEDSLIVGEISGFGGRDATGRISRQIDVASWFSVWPGTEPLNLTFDTVGTIDLGAYEFTPLKIVPTVPYTVAISSPEDTVFQIDLAQYVEGGYGELNFVRVDPEPVLYGTQCGPEYTDANKGIVFEGNKLFYCPPANFYTDDGSSGGAGKPNLNNADLAWPDSIDIKFNVTDATGASAEEDGTIILTITPVADTPIANMPTTPDPAYTYTIAGAGPDVEVQLRPYVILQDSNAAQPKFSLNFMKNNEADFVYAYGSATLVTTSETGEVVGLFDADGAGGLTEAQQLTNAFNTITPDGKITILTNGLTGFRDFTYIVTDKTGSTRQMRVRVRIVNTIPIKGLYDDTSFAFRFQNLAGNEPGSWLVASSGTSINNTLHTTYNGGDNMLVSFRGTGFILYMVGYAYGDVDLDLFRGAGITSEEYLQQGNWTPVAGEGGDNQVYSANFGISSGNIRFKCSTQAFPSPYNTAYVYPVYYGGYTISCKTDPGELRDTYTLRLTSRTPGAGVSVDAISVLDDTLSADLNDNPLTPGTYDVDQLVTRGVFNNGNYGTDAPLWDQVLDYYMSKYLGYTITTDSVAPAAKFRFTNATGFAIGTVLDYAFQTATYRICVKDLTTPSDMCQTFSNTPTIYTYTRYGTYRPFWGYNPTHIYEVTLQEIDVVAGGRLLIDDIVVFPDTLVPESVLPLGTTNDSEITKLVYGSPILGTEDSWVMDTFSDYSYMRGYPGAYAGPFVGFYVPDTADTISWKYRYTYADSTRWMVCVDRALGYTTLDRNGRCIIINARPNAYTGDPVDAQAYRVVNIGNPTIANGTQIIQPMNGELIIRESMFHGSTWGAGANGRHIVEVFSLSNEPFNLDSITVLESTAALLPGTYEETTPAFSYWEWDTVSDNSFKTTPVTYETYDPYNGRNFGDKPFILDIYGYSDSGAGSMNTRGVKNAIFFNFTGTGFAPRFRIDPFSDEIRICWQVGAVAPTAANVLNVLTSASSTCYRVDNESPYYLYQAERAIYGLSNNTYSVAIQFLTDNHRPNAHLSYYQPLNMWFDGVKVVGTEMDPTSLTSLTYDTVNETNYNTRVADNKFIYYSRKPANWYHINYGYAAGLESGNNYDARSDYDGIGSGIMFRVDATSNNANALSIYRDVIYGYADMEVCSYPVGSPLNRTCTMLSNATGYAYRVPGTHMLAPTPTSATYIVTMTVMNYGAVNIDAIKPVQTATLTAGTYEDTNPSIFYDSRTAKLVENGDMEYNQPATWTASNNCTATGSVTSVQFAFPYRGFYGNQVTTGSANHGIKSKVFTLNANTEYTLLAHVAIPANYTGSAVLQLCNGTATAGTDSLSRPSSASISTAAGTMSPYVWYPIRFDYRPGATISSASLLVALSGIGGSSTVYVDDVQVIDGGFWSTDTASGVYSGNTVSRSITPGAEANFSFTGTGFAFKTLVDVYGGETQVCYGTASPNRCMSYQHQDSYYSTKILRTVVGLPSNTYQVRIRDVEDGFYAVYASGTTPRPYYADVGRVAIDYVQIVNAALPPVIPSSLNVNDDYQIGGIRALQLLPTELWKTFKGAAEAYAYTNQTYAGITSQYGYPEYYTAGAAAVMNLNLTTIGSQATVIVDINTPSYYNSGQLLACVDGVGGTDATPDRVTYNSTTGLYELTGSTNCTLTKAMQLYKQAAFNPSNLPSLLVSGVADDGRTLTLQTLGAGQFPIDSYQVVYGNQLTPGYYEDTIGSALIQQLAGTWTTETSYVHSGGSALVSSTNGATIEFNIQNSTGFSLMTAYDYLGDEAQITVFQGVTPVRTETRSLYSYGYYQTPLTVAGLPLGNYRVQIVLNDTTALRDQRLVVDAIQVYGALQTLGSLYDDAQIDTTSTPLLNFGPVKGVAADVWYAVKGVGGYNDDTYRYTVTYDATLAFNVGTNATRVRLFYPGSATQVEVCFVRVSDGNRTCELATLDYTAQYKDFPTAGALTANNYNVTISNKTHGGFLLVDAVQILESTLAEGVYDMVYMQGPPAIGQFGGTWTTAQTYSNIKQGSAGATFEVTFQGKGISLILSEYLGVYSESYTVCIRPGAGAATTGTCSVVGGAANIPLAQAPGGYGDRALTYVGFTNGTYTLRITNTTTANRPLILKQVHVLGDKPIAYRITNYAEKIENNNPKLRYFPFDGMTEMASPYSLASGFSEHMGTMRGVGVYFEFKGTGIEYARNLSYGNAGAQFCYNVAGTSITAASTVCSDLSNDGPYVYQRTQFFNTTTPNCDGVNGCWGLIRSRSDAMYLPVDFVRLTDSTLALTAGKYEENYPGLQNFSGTAQDGGTYTLNPGALNVVAENLNYYASGYYMRKYTATTPNSALFGGMFFRVTGTGFTVNFMRDNFADAVRICYLLGATTPQGVISGAKSCETWDNYQPYALGSQARTIRGLPSGTYGVTVQLLADNSLYNHYSQTAYTHPVYETPLAMQIDYVTIYSDDWATLTPLALGKYEPRFDTQVTDNRFMYTGTWTTFANPAYTTYSGQNFDHTITAGSSVVFRTTGANAVTVYATQYYSYSPISICARALTGTAQERLPTCQTFLPQGPFSYQQPMTFRFDDPADLTDYVVWISTSEAATFELDAIEVVNTNGALTAGFYESTDPRINAPTVANPNLVVGGNMTTDVNWSVVGGASRFLYNGADSDYLGLYVAASGTGQGIQSAPLSASVVSGRNYTFLARVLIYGGAVRVQTTGASIGFPTSPAQVVYGNQPGQYPYVWATLRFDFTATGSGTPSLQFLSEVANTVFLVDSVWLIEQGQGRWVRQTDYSASGTSMLVSQTPGAELTFDFTGTGFEIGMPTSYYSGQVEVCYGVRDPLPTTYTSCFVYDQETAANYSVGRIVAGLPSNTYRVRVREYNDGLTSLYVGLSTYPAITYYVEPYATLDYIRIFNDTPVTIPAGYYNENAGTGGNTYLRYLPQNRWKDVVDYTGLFTQKSYKEVIVEPYGYTAYAQAHSGVLMQVNVPANQSTSVVLYTSPYPYLFGARMLVCAGDTTTGVEMSEKMVWNGAQHALVDHTGSGTDCVLKNASLDSRISISSTDLAILNNGTGSPRTVNLLFTPLAVGLFQVDGFQVIEGGMLAQGVYDDFMPDNVLNFNKADGTGSLQQYNPSVYCNPASGWCQNKIYGVYGGSAAQTNQLGASLNFSFTGSGFSIITSADYYGGTMRVCYRPTGSLLSFPNATNYSVIRGLFNADVWCDTVTTNTLTYLNDDWDNMNPARTNPFYTTQYGFSYYGFLAGSYEVEVRLIDQAMLYYETLTIDAVAVFGGTTTNLTTGLYDNNNAAIQYEPSPMWTQLDSTNYFYGPPYGPYQRTESTTTKAGSVMRLRTSGNALLLYQTVGYAGSRNIKVCLVLVDERIPCLPEGETNLAVQLTTFSQNGAPSYMVPVMFYGLGSGVHNLFFENLDAAYTLSVDAIRVQP